MPVDVFLLFMVFIPFPQEDMGFTMNILDIGDGISGSETQLKQVSGPSFPCVSVSCICLSVCGHLNRYKSKDYHYHLMKKVIKSNFIYRAQMHMRGTIY
jgi:hypothetical protein